MYVCMYVCMYVVVFMYVCMYAHTCATYFYSLACSLLADPKRYVVEFLRPRQGQGTLIAQRAHFIVHNFEFQKGNSILKLNFSFTFREMHHHVHCILAYKFENAQCSLQARFPIFSSIIYLAATAVDPAASLPIAIAVSCSADRQVKAKITKDGVFIEKLETDPAHFLPATTHDDLDQNEVKIDLNQPMEKILAQLSKHPAKTRVSLTGTLVVARDLAHSKIKELIDSGKPMPKYLKDHAVYYAGPAKTPTGLASGSFGPTTAGRMDSYVEEFQAAGGSLIMLAKGNRSAAVAQSCKKYGGFYLGSIGGPAARLAQDCIKKVEVLDYEELGMEAVFKIEVENFPAFIIIDDKGNDFYAEIRRPLSIGKGPSK